MAKSKHLCGEVWTQAMENGRAVGMISLVLLDEHFFQLVFFDCNQLFL